MIKTIALIQNSMKNAANWLSSTLHHACSVCVHSIKSLQSKSNILSEYRDPGISSVRGRPAYGSSVTAASGHRPRMKIPRANNEKYTWCRLFAT